MKKYLGVICCIALISSIAGVVVARAGYYTGPNNSLYMSANAGTLWVEGTLANDSARHYKQVYAQAGKQGSWSKMVEPSVHSVTQRDSRGVFEPDNAYLKTCWKV